MAKFLNRVEWRESVSYALVYSYVGEPGRGFEFPCDQHGNVEALPPVAQTSYEQCLANSLERPVVCEGVVRYPKRYKVPARICCESCNEVVVLADPMTNACRCGQLYNSAGQQLAHPSTWGDETGERFDARGNPIL